MSLDIALTDKSKRRYSLFRYGVFRWLQMVALDPKGNIVVQLCNLLGNGSHIIICGISCMTLNSSCYTKAIDGCFSLQVLCVLVVI